MSEKSRKCLQQWQSAVSRLIDVATTPLGVPGESSEMQWYCDPNINFNDLELLLRTFCRNMPKCEFHAHLSGCISGRVLRTIQSRRRYGPAMKSEAQLHKLTLTPRNLEQAFQMFPSIHELIVTPEDVCEATIEVIRDFSSENVVYLELRSTPRRTDQMLPKDYVKALVEGVIKARQICPNICVRVLLSIDRQHTVEQAEEIVNLAMRYRYSDIRKPPDGVVIGIDISGDPRIDARKFLPLLKRLKSCLPVISFHLGETPDHLDEVPECLNFGPTRISHATYLDRIPNEEVRNTCMELIRNKRIPIEICLGADMACGSVKKVNNSHFTHFYAEKHPVLISTGNREMMGCSLTDEYARIASALGFSPKDVFQLSFSATKYLDKFLLPEERNYVLNRFYHFASQMDINIA